MIFNVRTMYASYDKLLIGEGLSFLRSLVEVSGVEKLCALHQAVQELDFYASLMYNSR